VKEVPYKMAVVVESFKEEQDLVFIRAVFTWKSKGQKGHPHRQAGNDQTESNRSEEAGRFFGTRVRLELFVKSPQTGLGTPSNWQGSLTLGFGVKTARYRERVFRAW